MGPFPPDDQGNTYIIAILDSFTRWVELYAAPDATAHSALLALMAHNKTFGQAHRILSDNGSQYVNAIIEEWCHIVGTEHVRTVPHSHEENGLIERANKETLRHLRALVYDDKSYANWSRHLATVQRILNTSTHEAIGVAPARLVFGNAIELSRAVYLPVSSLNVTERQLSDWADKQICAQAKYLESAENRQRLRDEEHMKERSKLMKTQAITIFTPGSWVKAAYPHTLVGQRAPNKLRMPWRGPYQVIERTKGAYNLRDVATGKLITISEHLLEPYYLDAEVDNPRDEALKEQHMHDIEAVLDYKAKPNRLAYVQLLIKWADQPDPEWQSWNRSFRHNRVVHDYFRSLGSKWASIIPPQYKIADLA